MSDRLYYFAYYNEKRDLFEIHGPRNSAELYYGDVAAFVQRNHVEMFVKSLNPRIPNPDNIPGLDSAYVDYKK